MKMRLLIFAVALLFGCSKKADPSPTHAGKFTFQGKDYITTDASVTDVGSGGALGNIDVLMATTSGTSFIVYNMPKGSSGSSAFTDVSTTVGSSSLYALLPVTGGEYGTKAGGTITKTGSNSFTFTCTVTDITNTATSYTVTGSGTY